MHPKVTVIIPNYNGLKFMDRCMDALARQTYTDFVVLIVDNGSTDGSVEYLQALAGAGTRQDGSRQDGDMETSAGVCEQHTTEAGSKSPGCRFPVQLILLKDNTGFSGAVNVGISAAGTDYVALLNNDTEADPDYLLEMMRVMEADGASAGQSRIFAVSPRMVQLYHPALLDDAGDGYNLLGWAFQRGVGQPATRPKFSRQTEVFSACAGAALYRRDLLEEIRLDKDDRQSAEIVYEDLTGRPWPAHPYFDPMHFAYLEDLDVCFRARIHGYKIFYAPASKVLHVGSGTSGSKYNAFKVRLAARNNLWLNYKNMPLLMLLINLPGILAGVLVKLLFFLRLGFGGEYAKGFLEGLASLPRVRQNKTRFRLSRLPNYLWIEWKLLTDTCSYIEDFAVRQFAKLRRR